MTQQLEAVVFFKTDHLGKFHRHDRNARSELVRRGIAEIRAAVPTVELGQPNPTSCSVPVSGPIEIMEEIQEYLLSHPQLGKLVFDGPMIGSALRRPLTSQQKEPA